MYVVFAESICFLMGSRLWTENIVAENIELCKRFLSIKYITHKDLTSQIDEAMHIASLVPTVRPFLNELYAALHDKNRTGPTAHSVWAKQIVHSITWLLALLQRNRGTLTRTYDLDVFFGHGDTVDLCVLFPSFRLRHSSSMMLSPMRSQHPVCTLR